MTNIIALRSRDELAALQHRIAEAKDKCRAALQELSKHTAFGGPDANFRAIASLYEAIDEYVYDDVSLLRGRM